MRMAAASTLVAVAIMRSPSRVARRGSRREVAAAAAAATVGGGGSAAADAAPAEGGGAAEPPAATGVAAAADAQALGSVSLRPRRMRMRKLRSSTKG